MRPNREFLRSITAIALVVLTAAPAPALAQVGAVTPIDLSVGRSLPITESVAITQVSIANPEVADIAVIGTREFVINAKTPGETDAILWLATGQRRHFRISVRSAPDRQQIAIYIKLAEVRRDVLRQIGVSGEYTNAGTRVGTGVFRADPRDETGKIVLQQPGFATILTDLGTQHLLALIDLEEQNGRARTLAEPNILAGNREPATFLAGGEIPIPVVQGGDLTGSRITIEYKEFGVRLNFIGEILSDELIKLTVAPEVSSVDFVNGVTLSGFRIPAFRTRRVSTTVDVRRDQSMIISGLFSSERERVRTGVPFIQNIPLIGQLFSSTRWQNSDSELLVVVTPVILDPLRPRPQDTLQLKPDTDLPARESIEQRLQDPRWPHGVAVPQTR